MTDREILDLVHNLVSDDFVQDLAMHALPDAQPSHEDGVRLMREASERIGLIYSIVHSHLPRECHHVHQGWRNQAAKLHAENGQRSTNVDVTYSCRKLTC